MTLLLPPLPSQNQHSFLVRLWRRDVSQPWRFLVHDIIEDKPRLFDTWDDVALFLQKTMDDWPDEGKTPFDGTQPLI